ncbi:hypothetical protein E4U21_007375, partial [Claviceps maximensis]
MPDHVETGMPLRRLQPIELVSSSRHHMGLYLCVVLSCRYTWASSGPDTELSSRSITPELLYPALGRLVAAQPMLRVGILDEDTNEARFCHVPRVHLPQHVSFTTLPEAWGWDDDDEADSDGEEEDTQGRRERQYDEAVAAVHARHHDRRFEHVASRPAWRIEV